MHSQGYNANHLRIETADSVECIQPTYHDDVVRLFDAVSESSLVLYIRFPNSFVPALRPDQLLRDALAKVLLEPCHITIQTHGAYSLTAVVTPNGGTPFDPLETHTLIDTLKSELLPMMPEDGELCIRPMAYVSPVHVLQENLTALDELLETLVNRRLRAQFQPIVHVASGRIHGYEALIRAPQGGILKRLGELFRAADRARLVSWLDIACMEQCFTEAKRVGCSEYLFINMDAEGLEMFNHADNSLADKAREFGISPNRIVVEITERQAVDDYPRLNQYIQGLRSQGVKIAIDDAGQGYSSLHAIADMRPEFVKIDRGLIRNIESSGARRALLETLTKYASSIGAAIIAEGIETCDELAAVVEAGASYCQGYLLAKPNDGFRNIRRESRELMAKYTANKKQRDRGSACCVGQMALRGVTLQYDAQVEQVARRFGKTPELESIVILDGSQIEGLMMRDRFDKAMLTIDNTEEMPISSLMDRQPLIVEADRFLDDVALQATYKREMRFADDIIVADGRTYVGVLSLRAIMTGLAKMAKRSEAAG